MLTTPEQELYIASLNHNVALLTIIGFIIVIAWAIKLVLFKTGILVSYKKWFELFATYLLPLGFFMTLFATVMSLYYQFSLHIEPCELCWFARVFMYPLVFIFGFAWVRGENAKQTKLYDHVIVLSVVGLAISLYHHYLQLGFNLYKPCSTAVFAVDCAKPTFIEFGFITYPFMAVVVFSATILLSITGKMFHK